MILYTYVLDAFLDLSFTFKHPRIFISEDIYYFQSDLKKSIEVFSLIIWKSNAITEQS